MVGAWPVDISKILGNFLSHIKKICIQGLQGRHALSMLGRTLVSNRLLLDNMTQYIEIVLLLYSIYYREAFKRKNYHKFHSLSATHKNFSKKFWLQVTPTYVIVLENTHFLIHNSFLPQKFLTILWYFVLGSPPHNLGSHAYNSHD